MGCGSSNSQNIDFLITPPETMQNHSKHWWLEEKETMTIDLPAIFHCLPKKLCEEKSTLKNASAFIPRLERVNSEEIVERWTNTDPATALDEYKPALEDICLQPEWLAHTKLSRYLTQIKEILKRHPELSKQCESHSFYEQTLLQLIRKAFRLADDHQARMATDIVYHTSVFPVLLNIRGSLSWRKPYLTFALLALLRTAPEDFILGKLSEACDRATRCSSAIRQAFNLLVTHGMAALESEGNAPTTETPSEGSEGEQALVRVKGCFEDYLDDHKERAFDSAFLQPARFYFDLMNNAFGRDHVNIHGINYYLAIIHSTLGMRLPLMPEYGDTSDLGLVPFWEGLSDAAWTQFSDPLVFGKAFEAIGALKPNRHSSFLRTYLSNGYFPSGHKFTVPKVLANQAVDPSSWATPLRKGLMVYLTRFAHFFSRGFFLRKAFEGLNAETKPEHLGFRHACEVLFKTYRHSALEGKMGEVSYMEYFYSDDMFTQLDVERVGHFFAWLGLVKPTEGTVVPPLVFLAECPICMELKTDVQVLEHWEVAGDISGHKLCEDCKAGLKHNECPFCKEILYKEEFLVYLRGFVASWSQHVGSSDHNNMAAVFEQWQFLEMELGGKPRQVYRMAQLVLEDPEFRRSLGEAVRGRCEWLRDIAGIVFRFWGLLKEGVLRLSAEDQQVLEEAVEVILAPFERRHPVLLNGHFYGALYTQVLAAWLCAQNGGDGMGQEPLAGLTRRVGKAVVHCFEQHGRGATLRAEVAERMHEQYLSASHYCVWRSKEEDPVWNAFCKV